MNKVCGTHITNLFEIYCFKFGFNYFRFTTMDDVEYMNRIKSMIKYLPFLEGLIETSPKHDWDKLRIKLETIYEILTKQKM